MPSLLHAALRLLPLLALSGCASLSYRRSNQACTSEMLAAASKPYVDFAGHDTATNADGSRQERSVADFARDAYLYAMLANNAYPLELSPRDPSDRPTVRAAVGPPGAADSLVSSWYALPDSVHLAASDSIGWSGFAARAYVFGDTAAPSRVVIAYRGTEGLPLLGHDWMFGNLGTAQHTQALRFFDQVRARYQSATPSADTVPITVTGHSLGGALAIHISNVRPEVNAYVFNASYRRPFYGVGPLSWRPPWYDDTTIYQMVGFSETGEALRPVRGILTNPTLLHMPGIDCTVGGPSKNHSMRLLARCITRIAAFADSGAQRALDTNPATCRDLKHTRAGTLTLGKPDDMN